MGQLVVIEAIALSTKQACDVGGPWIRRGNFGGFVSAVRDKCGGTGSKGEKGRVRYRKGNEPY